MLGRLEMDVDECISVYSELMKSVFKYKARRFPISLTGKTKSRFKSTKLEAAIKKAIIRHGSNETDLFNNGVARRCKVLESSNEIRFVCTIAHETKEIVRLRSYDLPGKPDIRATISEAALATSAATTLFDPVEIGARKFADGALGANNPAEEVEGEASDIWCPDTADLKPLVKCFISIGTGNPGKKPVNLKMFRFLSRTLVEIATETDNTEKRFIAKWRQHFDEKRYFRFNVDQGLQHIKLTEYKEQGAIEAATHGYLDHQAQGTLQPHSMAVLEKAQADKQDLKSKCDTWLRPPNMKLIHHNQIREKLRGTCDWIWSHPTFSAWNSTSMDPSASERRLLCIYGTHGCGKTVLASSVIESLKMKGNRVLFFAFSGADTSRQSLDDLARSLLAQLLQESVPDESFESMRGLMSHGQPLTFDLWTVFKKITISASGPVYWIIDGVDESKESSEEILNQVVDLLNAIKDARAILLGRTHVLKPIQQANHAIEITPNLIRSDIDSYINTEIDKSRVLKSPEIRDLASKTLHDGSQGMFLWVKLMIGDLCRPSSEAETIQRLHNLPRGLQKAYQHLFLQLVEDLDNLDLRFAKRLLAFVIAARRPLKLEELQYVQALASKSDSKMLHELPLEAYIIEDIVGKVLRTCGSCIKITDGVIFLSHISAKEFLTRPESEWSCDDERKISCLRIDLEESHSLFVSTCINYLEVGGYGFPLRDQDDIPRLYGVFPFLNYASKNLLYHINRAQKSSADTVDKFDQFTRSEAFLSWIEYFIVHIFIEDEFCGLEPNELTMWLENSEEEAVKNLGSHLRERFEDIIQNCDEGDRRLDQYRMLIDILTEFDSDESTGSLSNYQTTPFNLTIRQNSNDIHQTIPMITEAFKQSSMLTAPKQFDLLLRLQQQILRAKALTDPLEFLFRLILKNAKSAPVYALIIIGNFYKTVGQLEKALQVYQSALAKFEKLEAPIKYAVLHSIGHIFSKLDRFQESGESFRQAAEGRERIFGQNHAGTLLSLQRLGFALWKQSKYKEAEEILRQAVKGRQKILGLEHRKTIYSMAVLGDSLYDQENYSEAEEILRQVVKGRQKILGPESERTLNSMATLGCILYYQRKYPEAEEILRQVVKGQQKILGPESEHTLNSMATLGCILYNQRKYPEAEEIFQQLLNGRREILGPKHEETLLSMQILGKVFAENGKYGRAKELLEQAAKWQEETLGPSHDGTLRSMEWLAEVSRCLEESTDEEDPTDEEEPTDDGGAVFGVLGVGTIELSRLTDGRQSEVVHLD
ncbi:hypothetical protein Daesc_001531 [Daldinia eschscholtzii]|uniref:Uncharacterized protein n=1 Tax=Daldinia eschscholtzii TaxID=292717 RepID=A0AAX6MV26_9PEZI